MEDMTWARGLYILEQTGLTKAPLVRIMRRRGAGMFLCQISLSGAIPASPASYEEIHPFDSWVLSSSLIF